MKNKLFVALSFLTFFSCLVGCSNPSDSSQGVSFDNGCYECKNCLYHSGLLSSGEGVDFGDGPFECPNCHENDMYVVQSASIKDFSAGIKLLDDGQTKMCPYMNKAYLVTTTKDFVLTVYSNKDKTFTDDVVIFPAATGVVDGDVHYTSFGSYRYDASYDKSSYVLNFTQKGKFEIILEISTCRQVRISVNCDDENLCWSPVINASDAFSWMKNVSAENVTKVKEKFGNYSDAVDKFQNVKYSTNSADISSLCNLFDIKVQKINTYTPYKQGKYSEYTYYVNNSLYTVRVENNKYIIADDGNYILSNQTFSPNFGNPSETGYSFLTKQARIGVDGLNYGVTSHLIDYLDKIDFVELRDESMDGKDAIYVISDSKVTDPFSPIYIYDANTFSYKNVFYRIISEQNFSNLFAN